MSMELKLKEEDIIDLARFGLKQAIALACGHLSVAEVRITGLPPMEFDLSGFAANAPNLGEYWEGQGGIRVVPGLRDEQGRIYDLVAVTGEDRKTPAFFKDREWGNFGTRVEGCESKRDGIANTKALVAAGNPLAKDIAGVVSPDGHTDCYWLSQAELMACYVFSPQLFGDDVYWSSTQDDSDDAWGQNVENGYVYDWYKYSTSKAFPVRRVYR